MDWKTLLAGTLSAMHTENEVEIAVTSTGVTVTVKSDDENEEA